MDDIGQFRTVVGIGASAGGIDAFRSFFGCMPKDSGLSFVVILHLPADRKSILPELIARWSEMPVEVVEDGCAVEPETIYLPPSGVALTYRQGRLYLHRPAAEEQKDLNPITMLFNSLAAELHENAIGIVMSGTGSDGALGLKAIKEVGGLTLVQGRNGGGPQYDGMPASAIATGAVDIVAPVEAMPGHILAIQQARRNSDSLSALTAEQLRAGRLAICRILNRQLGHDFSGYKDKTFMRRVQRRMHVLNLASLDAFVMRLGRDRDEVMMLFRDLLIGVTSFFRDEDTFSELKKRVIPRIFHGVDANSTVRVWVPGCATGEEVYSLAMLLREYADGLEIVPKIQVFATDIDEAAIATARAGRYPSTLLAGMSAKRLARFFVPGLDGSYTVAKEAREICTFSAHSLIRDPPFSRINLLSCRNLLIYLDVDQQAIVIPAFHYSLVPGGILLLGTAETINRHEALFSTLDRHHRIFQRRDVPSPPLRVASSTGSIESTATKIGLPLGGWPQHGPASKFTNWANMRVLEQFAPPFLVVTAEGRSVQYSDRVTQYLELPAGQPSNDVFLMARKGLRAPLRAALKEAVTTGHTSKRYGLQVTTSDSHVHRITLVVEQRREQGGETLYLIVFLGPDSHDMPAGSAIAPTDAVASAIPDRRLEIELRDTREQLQSIAEEHDTALEELKSSNEELSSVNEELQSTNEELETSKEEIQSINEELQTVNAQLATKVDELDSKNSDLKNLFESTQVATLFLDRYMIVRSYTPAVANIYNLIPSDQGRPITDIVTRLQYRELRSDCLKVLRTLQPLERRVVRDDDVTHYLMRILPYRTPDSAVVGTIITFVDVTSVVAAEQHQRLLVDELNHRVRNMLTVVLAMATQTMRRSSSIEEFRDIYTGRVHALSAAYSLLSNEGWQTISLEDLLQEELKPFRTDENVVIHGPLVALEPHAALALGMAIHELTTNAVKYGALSVPEGKVRLDWRVEQQSTGKHVIIEWTESGGPAVVTPSHRGFGMTLIERGLRQDMAADVEVDFAASGVCAKITAPLSRRPSPIPEQQGPA